MKGGAFLILGWLFMTPFALYEGSKQLARAPLGSDGDGKVRWVARALDPTSREVDFEGEKYWYFASAPTVEIRLYRDTDAAIELTSFEIADAVNIDRADVGQRIDEAPLALQKSHAFEVWPADESKPISFRFHGTYRVGEQHFDFGGTLRIDSVYPRGPQDEDAVERVPVAQALQVARSGASFSLAKGPDRDTARAKEQRRRRLAEERAQRDQQLAAQRRARDQERAQSRQAQRAFAQQIDQARQDFHQEYDARKEQQRQERERWRAQQEAAKRQREEQIEAQRAFEQRRRDEALRAQREQAERQRAERQRAEQLRQEQARVRQQERIRQQNEKNRARHVKVAPMKIDVGLAPALTPKYEKKETSSNSSKQTTYATGTLLGAGEDCPAGYRPQSGCPPGKKCGRRVGCKKDPDYEKQQAHAQSRSTRGGIAQANSGPSASSSSQPTGAGSTSSGGQASDGCPGPADQRRLEGTCVEVVESARGRHCGSKTSLQLRLRNKCNERIYTMVCLERPGEEPMCGSFGIRPGATHSTWTCEATGAYFYHAVFVPEPRKDWVCSDWN